MQGEGDIAMCTVVSTGTFSTKTSLSFSSDLDDIKDNGEHKLSLVPNSGQIVPIATLLHSTHRTGNLYKLRPASSIGCISLKKINGLDRIES